MTALASPQSTLHQNPFWVLGVTVRDNRQRIVQRADDRSLELAPEVCQKARTDLTVPRSRLGAELAWLPGVAPSRAAQLATDVLRDPQSARRDSNKLPALARLNLMTAGFELTGNDVSVGECAWFLQDIAAALDELSVEDIRRDVNEDRAVSGFPQVPADDSIERELVERRRQIRDAAKSALNQLPTATLIAVMTSAVETATASGQRHAPLLLDELVDSYEVEAHEFLSREAENVVRLCGAIRDMARRNPGGVPQLVDSLEKVVRNWDRVAQPIQLSAKARGLSHSGSNEVASELRSLSIDVFNSHDLVAVSRRLTALLSQVFAEVPVVAEQAVADTAAINSIVRGREEMAEAITYEAEVGLIGKSTLSISPSGVAWKNRRFPLAEISRVRWGGVSRSVNGIPTGTTYTIAFGDEANEAVVSLRRNEVYSAFIDKLWKAVAPRLMSEMAQALKAGGTLRMADATITDRFAILKKHKWFGSEQVKCLWADLRVFSESGSLIIRSSSDNAVYATVSYIDVENTHILEQLIRIGFKRGCTRLSDVLDS